MNEEYILPYTVEDVVFALAKALSSVQSVNGVKPNKEGKIELPKSVSSWNDLEDRPFYEEMNNTILDNAPISIVNDEGTDIGMIDITEQLLFEGNTYTVNWNGVDYTTEAFSVGEDAAVGMGNTAMMEEDNGIPFVIVDGISIGQPSLVIMAVDGTYPETLTIKGVTIKKIDEKYLPEQLQFGSKTTEVFKGSNLEWNTLELSNEVYLVTGIPITEEVLNVGETYLIKFGSAEYSCICEVYNDNRCIGNLGNIGQGENNGVPFIIMENTLNNRIDVYSFNEETPNKIIIYKEDIKTIDAKYLPTGNENKMFIVNVDITNGDYLAKGIFINSSDKTFTEIKNAINSNKYVFFNLKFNDPTSMNHVSTALIPLSYCKNSEIYFTHQYIQGNKLYYLNHSIDSRERFGKDVYYITLST